jgi:hypothetical protein
VKVVEVHPTAVSTVLTVVPGEELGGIRMETMMRPVPVPVPLGKEERGSRVEKAHRTRRSHGIGEVDSAGVAVAVGARLGVGVEADIPEEALV